ncbi:hypothetical protein HDU76_011344 [Blyttiomyces sp. JEL0837]|nr:hypothetical protein HDU76_011344 [Blyttiomyces sp. JEL0837]
MHIDQEPTTTPFNGSPISAAKALTSASLIFEQDFDNLMTLLLTADKRSIPAVLEVITAIESIQSSLINPGNRSKGIVSTNHIASMKKTSAHWLTSVQIAWNKKLPLGEDGQSVSDEEREVVEERVVSLLASLASMGGTSEPISKEWTFGEVTMSIRELSFSSASFGWQTWGSAVVLARMIADGLIPVQNQQILELGCGTGLVGLAAGKIGAEHVYMTDYMPEILENAKYNANENHITNVSVHSLDWRDFQNESRGDHVNGEVKEDGNTAPIATNKTSKQVLGEEAPDKFDIIIAADVCYELEHAALVPNVGKYFMSTKPSARFYMVSALRDSFEREIVLMEESMIRAGFILEFTEDIDETCWESRYQDAFNGPDRGFRFYVYRR